MELPKSGVVVCDESSCTGCGVCELMCSLFHYGMSSPALSRVQVVHNPFADLVNLYACQQCDSPGCYLACPLPDEALCIDELTGARYIDEEECTGCGLCVDACSCAPPRVRFKVDKGVVFKCDLCRGREAGPACVEYCGYGALRFLPGGER
jgi:Fe-S-cluster-containing hydrogenase component 2